MHNQDKYYESTYSKLLNSGLLGKFSNFTHYFMEKDFNKDNYSVVLELGAGQGQHKKFVRHHYDQYFETDIRIMPELPQILFADAEKLDAFEDHSVDRILATCLIAHLAHPEKALQEWKRVVKKGGLISLYIPCEPGLALRLFRFFSTNIKGKSMGVDHYNFHYLEHRNYFINLKYVIKTVFPISSIGRSRFPFPYLGWNFNFFEVWNIQVNE
jgi:phosphatidylethanolamine/phosphatidyl-N-methylethanolamine N-methyltransferase